MGESANHHGERQQGESPEIAEGKIVADQPLLNAGGKQPDDGIADAAVEEPKHGQRHGQGAEDQSGGGVKIAALRSEAEEVFEIGRHGADDDGGDDPAGFSGMEARRPDARA